MMAADQRLDALVTKMNAASGQAKADATAADMRRALKPGVMAEGPLR